jgi:hypothetical protein
MTMTIEGVDYSESRPSPTGLVKVGKEFVGRYVGAGFGPKLLDTDEAHALTDAGLMIVSLVEGADPMEPLQGFGKGQEHGRLATEWHHGHGFPTPPVFYFAVDFDVQPEQWPTVQQYLQGAASIVGIDHTGIYGGLNAVEWAHLDDLARWFFQTFAWSNGQWFNGNQLEQYRNDVSLVGGTVDLDRAPTPWYGGWNMSTQAQPPAATDQLVKDIHWSVGRGAPTQPGHEPAGNEAITYWCGHTTDHLVALKTAVDALGAVGAAPGASVDLAPVLTAVAAVQAAVEALAQAPAVDAVAVAQAIAADPAVVGALAAGVASRLSAIDGEIALTGTMRAGVKPPVS